MPKTSEIKIQCAYDKLVDIKSLKPHPKNPNTHSEEQIKRLSEIIRYQGFRIPIKVSNQTKLITSGHGRLQAAALLEMKQVPVDYQDYETEEQEYADLVADNSISQWASLEYALINAELPNLGPDFDIDMLGLKDFELEPADLPEKELDENIQTEKECPSCGYKW